MSLRAVLAAVVLTAGISSCDVSRPDADRSTASNLTIEQVGGCIQADEASLEVYRDDEVTAAVAIMGEGRAGVVVSYEENGSVCNWLAAAERLTGAGYTVLLYDRLHGSEGAFVPAMTRLIRQRGVQEVALLGGSIGGRVADDSVELVTVGAAVNSVANDGPELLEPAAPQPEQQRLL